VISLDIKCVPSRVDPLQTCLCVDSDTSVCSTAAPSLADLDEELAQYGDLLSYTSVFDQVEPDEEDDDVESYAKSKLIPVKKLEAGGMAGELDSILMPPPSILCPGGGGGGTPLISGGPRATAASLGLKGGIDECLKISPDYLLKTCK